MVAIPEILLPLARARFELRVPAGDHSQDISLIGIIKSAISILSKDVNIDILDRNVGLKVSLASNVSFRIFDPYLKSISAVKYQAVSDNVEYGSFPLVFDADDYKVKAGDRKGAFVLVPDAEWPEAAYNRLRIDCVVGLDSDDPSFDAFTTAAVLMLRSIYDGVPVLREDSAYERIIRSLRRADLSEFEIIDGPGATIDPVVPIVPGGGGGGGIDVRVGWSDTALVNPATLIDIFDSNTFVVPVAVGSLYFVIWRSTASGGDPTEVHIAGSVNQRNIFGAAMPLATNDGVVGEVIVTVTTQKAALWSLENVRIV